VLSSAVGTEALTDFADIADIELVLIDAETTLRQLCKELRWNKAYYRLSQTL